MYALSLWNPWANFMAHNLKFIETRSWQWPYQLPCVVAIHAMKTWNGELYELCRGKGFIADLMRSTSTVWPEESTALEKPVGMHFGKIIAIGRMVKCVPTENAHERIEHFIDPTTHSAEMELELGDYSPGRWGFVFDKIEQLLKPVERRGFHKVWQWERTTPEAMAIEKRLTSKARQTPVELAIKAGNMI